MRILIAAYACQPGHGSEPGAGWNLVVQLASRHDVWVITRANNRSLIEAEITRSPVPNLHFVYYDLPSLLDLKRRPGGLYFYHYLWHLSLRKIATELHQAVGFDVAHHLTLGSFRYPSGLTHLGIPLVIGPVGGAEETPLAFWTSFGWRGSLIELVRWAANRAALFDPLVRRSYRKAALVLPVTSQTRKHLGRLVSADKMEIVPQSGVDANELLPQSKRLDGGTIRVLHVARLIHWKGTDLAVRAVAAARRHSSAIELTILGAGPQELRLKRLIRRLGISQSVTMLRRLDTMDDVYKLYGKHDIFLFPSLHESGGMAVLEAMAAGLPVVCLDLGGPGLSVTDECGVLVPATTPSRAVAEMASALLRFADEPEMRRQRGAASRARVAALYDWAVKAAKIDNLYERLQS